MRRSYIASLAVACSDHGVHVGCAGVTPMGNVESLYRLEGAGVAVGSAAGSDEDGNREVARRSFAFATGIPVFRAAMANGGITKIHHVDCKMKSCWESTPSTRR